MEHPATFRFPDAEAREGFFEGQGIPHDEREGMVTRELEKDGQSVRQRISVHEIFEVHEMEKILEQSGAIFGECKG